MPLDPFIEDITVTAAPVSAPTDAPGPPDRDAILAERGPAGAAGPALGQCTGESLESIVVGKRETAKTGKTKPGEQVGKDSLDRSDNLELPSEQLGSCTLSISALTLVSEMTRELMGEEKDGKCDAVPHRFAANQTGRCPRLQGRGLYLSVDRPSKLWTILSIWFAKTGLEEKAAGDAVEALMKTWQTWEPKTHLKGSSRRHAIHSYLRATRWCLLADEEPVLGQLNSQP
ncbi:unnamed protein product [Durusdinium trenchii]|uniref:Uncharacterized protein n=1 Tax=Durusdinium trenchii TaxID=1381693 RepID=A0ABP0QKC2_9DINO